MGKLGKNARKFAKKNLQSVYKRNRKLKSMLKKRFAKKNSRRDIEEQEEGKVVPTNVRRNKGNAPFDFSLSGIFTNEESNMAGDDSDSDGYLPEDSSLIAARNESETQVEDVACAGHLSLENRQLHTDFVKITKKLDRLKAKDKNFCKFLESYEKEIKSTKNEDYSDDEGDDEMSEDEEELGKEDGNSHTFFWTNSAFDSFREQIVEHQNLSALTSLLNGYRMACHYGAESTGFQEGADSSHKFQSCEAYSKILVFMLSKGDNLFRKLIGLSDSSTRKEKSSELKSNPKWNAVKPMIKSYLRSTLFLMNQVTETEVLVFALNQARSTIPFFNAFPSLLRRLLKTALQFWATSGDSVSFHAFGIIRDIATLYTSDWFDTCFVETYKCFIAHCEPAEDVQLKHIQFMCNSFAELCSVDVQKSSRKVTVSIQHLRKMLQQGLQMKKKEALTNMCSWQYISCIDLWVTFISANLQDYDLQPLLYMVIQIINGMTLLFHGPRYLPLRVKCIQWLNHLSRSSGTFIPVASLILDILECKGGDGGKQGESISLSSAIKVPKNLLKSRTFQEHSILSAIELLSAHFSQWSYHISFPELATIPLICLRKFHEKTSNESFKRLVKRIIDQAEQNVEFVRRKREEVSFSPKDQSSVELFLQLEKSNSHTPFTQYYKSIMEKAVTRNTTSKRKNAGAEKLTNKVQKLTNDVANPDVNGGDSRK